MRWIAVVIVALALQPPDAPRHDKYKDDPHAYCLQGRPVPNDKHGHECHCKLMCVHIDINGAVVSQEDSTCELYCSKNHCVCHTDEECPT